jgi:hypothetical protein
MKHGWMERQINPQLCIHLTHFMCRTYKNKNIFKLQSQEKPETQLLTTNTLWYRNRKAYTLSRSGGVGGGDNITAGRRQFEQRSRPL